MIDQQKRYELMVELVKPLMFRPKSAIPIQDSEIPQMVKKAKLFLDEIEKQLESDPHPKSDDVVLGGNKNV